MQIRRDGANDPVMLPDRARTQVAVNRMLMRVATEEMAAALHSLIAAVSAGGGAEGAAEGLDEGAGAPVAAGRAD